MDYNSYTFKNKVVDRLMDDDKKKKKKKPTPVSTLKKITKDGNTTTTITRHPSGEVTKSVLTKKMKSINN